ncbi:CocE/NonD family hydrolase [uncultured Jatrophihabitans sp.]|uniref:CocE/NonD family hydrolase n=1 Tax=uncultured Jatrophihabitans sp. TaxID=1610747 RepID=UPI0035C96438
MRKPAIPAAIGAAAIAAASLAACAALAVSSGGPAGAAAAYTVQTLHFAVHTGPDGAQACDIVGDLYTPASASAAHRVPAILTTNGFGGSKDDQAGIGKAFATRGYEVLSYSGLGFGGSGCKITLDDPDYDGKAAAQLVSYLGGAPGIAYTDAAHTTPAAQLTVVEHDGKNHAGRAEKYDPRVGMIGGSYGGEIQFAAAAVDPRVDTIVPLITWNDLSYSLDPNNTAQTTGVSTSTPGATKLVWGLGFSAEGVVDGGQGGQQDPSRLVGCPNFATFVCPALVTAGSTGYFQPADVASLRHASVATYLSKIKVPTLLMQGENDTLFNLNEAAATYRALKAQGTPVKMVWQSWGHSESTPAPGELDLDNPNPATQYETARIADWFAHYLRGSSVSTGPQFAYFRDWVSYSGIATPAYATSSSFPVGAARTYTMSGDKTLAPAGSAAPGSQTFTTPPAGAPSSIDPVDVLSGYSPVASPAGDAPGTFASWTGATLGHPLDVAGSPVARFTVQAPSAALSQSTGPAGQLVLFVKVEDVAPDGTASAIHGLEAPIRVPDVGKRVTVTLPAIVHRFAVGHSVRLVVAGGSVNYRGGLTPTPVTIAGGSGQTLTLPAVG